MKVRTMFLASLVILLSLIGAQRPSVAQESAPEGVTLDYFIATAHYPDYILLEWESVSELNTQAYRLKRGVTANPAQAVVITPVIPAHPGSIFGYYYSYQDSNGLVDGTTYYYWIEDQDLGGSGNWNAHLEYNPVVTWGFVCSRYDFDCNQVVDTLDVTAVAGRWGCAMGNPCYQALYDLNNDNLLNVIDISLDAARWGCSFGQPCYG